MRSPRDTLAHLEVEEFRRGVRMGKYMVFFDCVSGSDGSKRYSIRLDPYKPSKSYDEEEFWQMMLNCFSAPGLPDVLCQLDS
jgi:hypothetical protein